MYSKDTVCFCKEIPLQFTFQSRNFRDHAMLRWNKSPCCGTVFTLHPHLVSTIKQMYDHPTIICHYQRWIQINSRYHKALTSLKMDKEVSRYSNIFECPHSIHIYQAPPLLYWEISALKSMLFFKIKIELDTWLAGETTAKNIGRLVKILC